MNSESVAKSPPICNMSTNGQQYYVSVENAIQSTADIADIAGDSLMLYVCGGILLLFCCISLCMIVGENKGSVAAICVYLITACFASTVAMYVYKLMQNQNDLATREVRPCADPVTNQIYF